MKSARLSFWEPFALSVMRVAVGFTFSLHGLQKTLGWFGGLGGHGATAPLLSRFGAAGVLESVGGLLIVLGLFTRPAALVLCGEMAVAYLLQHAPHGRWPIQNGGELAVVYCFVFLFLATAGAGTLSLDRLVRRK